MPDEKERKAAALKFTPGVDAAPRLSAKGRGYIADRIVEIARANGVPVREDRHMVEILSTLKMGSEIPISLYTAAAEVLAFIYKTSKKV